MEYSNAALGGALVALGIALLLLFNGRIAGIGGTLGGLVSPRPGDVFWRITFLLGLVLGGAAVHAFQPALLDDSLLPRSAPAIVASGVIMGFGCRMANGCTSGHGVVGVSRLQRRSIVATALFFGTALLVAAGIDGLLGGRV